ncbi:MAG: glycosyltransferase family 4 protein [Acidobacteriia bacterium]|nr:glycosyltransferase family 4 protein [Terriglobia bacterium]
MSVGNPAVGLEPPAAPAGEQTSRCPQISVCHIASGDLWAGAEVQVATLLRSLARSGDFQLLAIFLNEGRLADEARACGVEVLVIPESQFSFFGLLRRATDFLRGRNVQVLHSHRYKENLLAALLASRLRIPVVVRTQHGAPEPVHGWKRVRQLTVHWLDSLAARYSTDRVIAVSENLRRQLARRFGDERVVVIRNGIDAARVCSTLTPQQARQRLGLPADCRVVGTAGRLEPVKRLDVFLEAARRMIAQDPGIRFLIAGEGSQARPLRQQAHRLGLSEHVVFTGHRADIYDVLRALDVFVLCSDHEGLPMVLLEAMALGVPVVVRPVGGMAEVVEDGVSGLWVPTQQPDELAARCLLVLRDPELCERLRAAALARVHERFSAESTARAVAELYRSLCHAESSHA